MIGRIVVDKASASSDCFGSPSTTCAPLSSVDLTRALVFFEPTAVTKRGDRLKEPYSF